MLDLSSAFTETEIFANIRRGPFQDEACCGFGLRVRTLGPEVDFARDLVSKIAGARLSPRTAMVLSVQANASVQELGLGESASAEVGVGGDFLGSVEPASEEFDLRGVLTARYENPSDTSLEFGFGYSWFVQVQSSALPPIPEASTYALLLLGLPLVAFARRRLIRR